MKCKVCKKEYSVPGHGDSLTFRLNICGECLEKTEETPFGRVIGIQHIRR